MQDDKNLTEGTPVEEKAVECLFLTQQKRLLASAAADLAKVQEESAEIKALLIAAKDGADAVPEEKRREYKARLSVLNQDAAFFKKRIKLAEKIISVIQNETAKNKERIFQTEEKLALAEVKLKEVNYLLSQVPANEEKSEQVGLITKKEGLESKCERLQKLKQRFEYVPQENALLDIFALKKYFPMAANFFGRTEADRIYSAMVRLRNTSRLISETGENIKALESRIATESDQAKKEALLVKKANTENKLKRLGEKQARFEESLNPRDIRRAHGFRPIERKKSALKAVDGVSFSIERGKTLGIVGESGCGKTTMGRTILRLHNISGGAVFFKGMDITQMKPSDMRIIRPQMQIIFQDPYSSLSPRLTVGEIIGEAVRTHNIVPKSEYKNYIVDIMTKCGLQPIHFNRYPHEFSGGQRQRICIARALALKPDFVVCDEPVSALDVSIQAQIINLLKDLQKEMNLTYLFISHDLSVVEHISDEIAVMYLGNMVEKGTKELIFGNPMHPYTKALFSAVPVPDPDVKMNRIMLKGDIPSPANPPLGCKFHTRCSQCMDICREKTPAFKEYEQGHFTACHLYDK